MKQSPKRESYSRLARVIDGQAKKRSKRMPVVDLATVQADGSLLLDHFSVPIPPDDFLVDESFAGELTSEESGGGGDSEFAAHSHDIRRPLEDGDRVYCLIVDADDDAATPIIVGRVVSGDA